MTSQSSDHHHKYHDEGREIEVQSGWPRNIFLAYHQSPPQGDFENQHKIWSSAMPWKTGEKKMDALLKSRIFAGVVVGFFYRFKS